MPASGPAGVVVDMGRGSPPLLFGGGMRMPRMSGDGSEHVTAAPLPSVVAKKLHHSPPPPVQRPPRPVTPPPPEPDDDDFDEDMFAEVAAAVYK